MSATPAEARPRASVRWASYAIVMTGLLTLGYVFSRSWLWPTSIMPGWVWFCVSGARGQAFYATAVILASGVGADATDLLLERGHRRAARMAVLLLVVGMGALAVVTFRAELRLVALAAALMACVGPLARRAFPGLPRARVRSRRP
jgi:hypothetical protein